MSGAVCRSSSLLQRHCVPLLYSLLNTQQQHGTIVQQLQHSSSSSSTYSPLSTQVRQYSADAPEPMIVPLNKQQTQQPATTGQRQELAVDLPDSNRGPWERVVDEKSGQPYWWNAKSGTTTPVGASKPDAWVAVVDQQTQAQYYWNKQSGETTAVGEPLPGPEGRIATASSSAPWQQQQQQRQPGVASALGNSLAVGFGVGLVFAIIRLVF